MTKVQTYCTPWRASAGSSMISYAWRDTLPELYVDYHEYKALEAENARLREALSALYSRVRVDADAREWWGYEQELARAALTQREGGEDE